MEGSRSYTALTLTMSGVALVLSAIAICVSVYQFRTQDRSDLLANCAFDMNAVSELEAVFEPYDSYSRHNNYDLKTKVRCLILNNGRKAVSVIRVKSVLTYDGQPIGGPITPVALFENDLVNKLELPIILAPGESTETNVWLRIDVGALTAKAVRNCKIGLNTYSNYDVCFHNNGFSIANYIYVEPYPVYFEGAYNGVGLQFVTNENKAITFEVSALRVSMIVTRGKLAKNYDEETFRPTYNEQGIYLERGYEEVLEVPSIKF